METAHKAARGPWLLGSAEGRPCLGPENACSVAPSGVSRAKPPPTKPRQVTERDHTGLVHERRSGEGMFVMVAHQGTRSHHCVGCHLHLGLGPQHGESVRSAQGNPERGANAPGKQAFLDHGVLPLTRQTELPKPSGCLGGAEPARKTGKRRTLKSQLSESQVEKGLLKGSLLLT